MEIPGQHQLPPELDTITGNFTSVHAFAPDDVWALGYNLYNVNSKVVVHWDGTSWSMMPDPGNGLDFAAVAPNELYVVGNKIKKWDGNSWNLIDTLPGITYGSLGSATVLPNGEIWAAGRSGDAAGNFYNLVYRYGSDSTTVGVSNISYLNEINIFPNPVKDELNVTISFNSEKEINIDLYNGAGQLMKEFVPMKLNSTKNEFSFSTAQLKSGIYYLKIMTKEDVLVRRIVKM